MGITVNVKVEGDERIPFEERTDGKPLADVVAGWIWFPEVVSVLRLSTSCVESLQLVDDSAYGEGDEEPRDMWQDPLRLKASLEELRVVLQRIRANPTVLDRIRKVSKGNASENFKSDRFDAYDAGVEDSIRICEWAASLKKRVALVAV